MVSPTPRFEGMYVVKNNFCITLDLYKKNPHLKHMFFLESPEQFGVRTRNGHHRNSSINSRENRKPRLYLFSKTEAEAAPELSQNGDKLGPAAKVRDHGFPDTSSCFNDADDKQPRAEYFKSPGGKRGTRSLCLLANTNGNAGMRFV